MHIHGSHMNMNSASLYSAAGAEKAAAAQRAAEVRKKLLRSASGIEVTADPDQAFLIGQWMNPQRSQTQNPFESQDEYHAGVSGKDPDFG
jgi:hypothetical protein